MVVNPIKQKIEAIITCEAEKLLLGKPVKCCESNTALQSIIFTAQQSQAVFLECFFLSRAFLLVVNKAEV